MLTKRIILCLDVKNGRTVKGTNFVGLKDAGDPVELGKQYAEAGADELIFLDITATSEKRKTLTELVTRIAKEIFIPFTVGGGIHSIEDIRAVIEAGADKVSIGSAAVSNPKLITEGAQAFGRQAITISVDAKRKGDGWTIFIKGGREDTGIDVLDFVREMEERGAGELLVNSLDRDGTKEGYDLELLKVISSKVSIPIIASSGVGNLEHLYEGIVEGGADAVLAASIFHFGEYSIEEAKKYLKKRGVEMRLALSSKP